MNYGKNDFSLFTFTIIVYYYQFTDIFNTKSSRINF